MFIHFLVVMQVKNNWFLLQELDFSGFSRLKQRPQEQKIKNKLKDAKHFGRTQRKSSGHTFVKVLWLVKNVKHICQLCPLMVTDYSIRDNYRILKEQDNVFSNFQYIFFSITCFTSKTMCVMMEPVWSIQTSLNCSAQAFNSKLHRMQPWFFSLVFNIPRVLS